MKKKELTEIIRFAVREELKKCLPSIIRECINNTPTKRKPTPTTSVEPTDPVELVKRVLKTESRVATSSRGPRRKQTSKELMMEALTATAGGIPQEGSRVGGDQPNDPTTTDFSGNAVDVSELPESVSSALTKDYSQLMAAINKKKGM